MPAPHQRAATTRSAASRSVVATPELFPTNTALLSEQLVAIEARETALQVNLAAAISRETLFHADLAAARGREAQLNMQIEELNTALADNSNASARLRRNISTLNEQIEIYQQQAQRQAVLGSALTQLRRVIRHDPKFVHRTPTDASECLMCQALRTADKALNR